jgi:hypothetical protein
VTTKNKLDRGLYLPLLALPCLVYVGYPIPFHDEPVTKQPPNQTNQKKKRKKTQAGYLSEVKGGRQTKTYKILFFATSVLLGPKRNEQWNEAGK